MPKKSEEPKRLTISSAEVGYNYRFEGPWTGRDIAIVTRMLDREYRMYQRSNRRKYKPLKGKSNVGEVTLLSPRGN